MRSTEYVTSCNLNEKVERWKDLSYQHSKERTNLELNIKRTALLVLDVQDYFASQTGSCFLPASKTIVPRIIDTIHIFKKNNAKIVLTKHVHHDTNNMFKRFYGKQIEANDTGVNIVREIHNIVPNALVLEKASYDAFLNTELEFLLKNDGIEQVLISGCMTHLCCDSTARAAFDRGFEVYFGIDLTFTSQEEFHIASLRNMASGIAKLISSEQIEGNKT